MAHTLTTVGPVRKLLTCCLALGVLTGCQGGFPLGQQSGMSTALRSLGGLGGAGNVTLVIVDAEAITKALGIRRDTDIESLTGPERLWLQEARNLGTLGSPLVAVHPSTMDYDWSAAGLSQDVRAFSIYGGASPGVVDEARASLTAAGYRDDSGTFTLTPGSSPFPPAQVVVDGDTIASIDEEKGSVLLGDDAPAIEHPEVSTIIGCLEGAHVAAISTVIPVGIAVRVEDGRSETWACMHLDDAQESAKAVSPSLEGVGITSVSVEGSVARFQLDVSDDGGPTAPLNLVRGLPESTFPGF